MQNRLVTAIGAATMVCVNMKKESSHVNVSTVFLVIDVKSRKTFVVMNVQMTQNACKQPNQQISTLNTVSHKKIRNFPGNFNCVCKKPNEYANCSKSLSNEETALQNVYLFFQPMVKLNQKQKFLLAIEKLGNVTSTVEISTENYVLFNTQASTHDYKSFQQVSKFQLQGIMKRLNLRNFEIPHERMYAVTFTNMLSTVGRQPMKLLVRRYTNPGSNQEKTVFLLSFYSLMVYKEDNYCSPLIHSGSCENSRLPREVSVDDFNVFKPIIQQSCGENSSLTYRWSIDHFVDQKTILNLPEEKLSFLRLAPFTLQFDDVNDIFSGFYSIKLTVFEDDNSNNRNGVGIWKVKLH